MANALRFGPFLLEIDDRRLSSEGATVDLTAQLVNMITAQRNFQANARAIETDNAMTQSLLNIS